tara:strand:+ start:48 stop:269 length:222 start_codon:yes stop_codon:yes gene_type:complete
MDIYTFKRDTYNFIKIVSKIHILLGARGGGVGEQDARLVVGSVARRGGESRGGAERARAAAVRGAGGYKKKLK